MYSTNSFDKSSKIKEINEALLGINIDENLVSASIEEGELINPRSLTETSKICSFKTYRKLLYSLEDVPSCRSSILFVARLVCLQQQACALEEHINPEVDSRKSKNNVCYFLNLLIWDFNPLYRRNSNLMKWKLFVKLLNTFSAMPTTQLSGYLS